MHFNGETDSRREAQCQLDQVWCRPMTDLTRKQLAAELAMSKERSADSCRAFPACDATASDA